MYYQSSTYNMEHEFEEVDDQYEDDLEALMSVEEEVYLIRL